MRDIEEIMKDVDIMKIHVERGVSVRYLCDELESSVLGRLLEDFDEIEELISKERLSILPCVRGAILFKPERVADLITEWKVLNFMISSESDKWVVVAETSYGFELEFKFESFGRDVFLVREDAAKNQKEMRNKKQKGV